MLLLGPDTENVCCYLKRVTRVNHVADDDNVPVFLSLLGGKTYSLLRHLFVPDAACDKALDHVIKHQRS